MGLLRIVLVVLLTVGWSSLAGPAEAGTVAASCARVAPVALRQALGVTRAVYVDGPSVLGGVCSWHGIQPNCFVRSLSVGVVRDPAEVRRLDAADARVAAIDRAYDVGDHAFFRLEQLPPGAAVMINHLYVKRRSSWVSVTLAGRLGPDGSRDQLVAVATSF